MTNNMPQGKVSIQDFQKQAELDLVFAGKSSGRQSNLIRSMQADQKFSGQPQGGGIESLLPINPLDLIAETAITGASKFEGVNPLILLLAGGLSPKAYKNIKTNLTIPNLKRFGIKIDSPIFHLTGAGQAKHILSKGKIDPGYGYYDDASKGRMKGVSLTRDQSLTVVSPLEKDIRLILDKSSLKKSKKIHPRSEMGKYKKNFESEEVVRGDIPSSEIKAISVMRLPSISKNIKLPSNISDVETKQLLRYLNNPRRENSFEMLLEAANRNIPVIIESTAINDYMKLLSRLNKKEKDLISKNIKFSK